MPATGGVYFTNNNYANTIISPSIFSNPTGTLGSYDYSGFALAYRFIFNNGTNDTVTINFGLYGSGVIHFNVAGVYSITGSFGVVDLLANITGLYKTTSLTGPVCVGNPSFTYNSYINAGDGFVVVKCYDQGRDYNFATVTITRLY